MGDIEEESGEEPMPGISIPGIEEEAGDAVAAEAMDVMEESIDIPDIEDMAVLYRVRSKVE